MSLVNELQSEVVDGKSDLSTVLRKAKVLASRLRSTELEAWVDHELSGYPKLSDVPDYRRLRVESYGRFVGSFREYIQKHPIPMSMLPEKVRDFAEYRVLIEPIKQLEALVRGAGTAIHPLRSEWPQEFVFLSRSKVKLGGGFELSQAWQEIPVTAMEGIVDQVRNRLLDLLLRLQEANPEIADTAIAPVPAAQLQQMVHYSIYGGNNVIASGHDFTVNFQAVGTGDAELLQRALREIGVPEPEIKDLEIAIKSDGTPDGNDFGANVKAWMGNAKAKISSGAWTLTTAAAPGLLVEALKRYFGW